MRFHLSNDNTQCKDTSFSHARVHVVNYVHAIKYVMTCISWQAHEHPRSACMASGEACVSESGESGSTLAKDAEVWTRTVNNSIKYLLWAKHCSEHTTGKALIKGQKGKKRKKAPWNRQSSASFLGEGTAVGYIRSFCEGYPGGPDGSGKAQMETQTSYSQDVAFTWHPAPYQFMKMRDSGDIYRVEWQREKKTVAHKGKTTLVAKSRWVCQNCTNKHRMNFDGEGNTCSRKILWGVPK